jgi:hypothetical protein
MKRAIIAAALVAIAGPALANPYCPGGRCGSLGNVVREMERQDLDAAQRRFHGLPPAMPQQFTQPNRAPDFAPRPRCVVQNGVTYCR